MLKVFQAALSILLLILIVYFLRETFAQIRWVEVLEAVHSIPPRVWAAALTFTALSYGLSSTFDWLSILNLGLRVPACRVYAAAFVSYVGNFNFGALIGALGLRYKLYSAEGLSTGEVARVATLSTIGNWVGFIFVAGAIFLLAPIELPDTYNLSALPLRPIGGLCVVLAIVYAALAYKRRHVFLHKWEVRWPGGRDAYFRVAFSILNWLTIGAILVVLFNALGFKDPVIIFGAYLAAAIAGVVVHVPAGLGVYEAVFLALLAPRIGAKTVMSGLLAFRLCYYLVPLVPAFLVAIALHATGNPRTGEVAARGKAGVT